MTERRVRSWMAVAALAGAVSLAPAAAGAQAMFDREKTPRQPRAESWVAEKANRLPLDPARTPWGEPDLRGTYVAEGVSSDNVESISEWLDPATPPTETFLIDPPDGKVPYQPWALAERNRFRAGLSRGWPGEDGSRVHMDPQTFCFTGIPRMAWRGNFQILQTPGYVFINLEWGHSYRVIPTDNRPNDLSESTRLWLGHSRGRWEGNTLVVEVTNLNGKQWLDSYANFYSKDARITERYTLIRTKTPGGGERTAIDWTVTIDDPGVYTRPWTMNLPLTRRAPQELWEHACHEGNEHHIEGAKQLNFQWFRGVVPPVSSNR